MILIVLLICQVWYSLLHTFYFYFINDWKIFYSTWPVKGTLALQNSQLSFDRTRPDKTELHQLNCFFYKITPREKMKEEKEDNSFFLLHCFHCQKIQFSFIKKMYMYKVFCLNELTFNGNHFLLQKLDRLVPLVKRPFPVGTPPLARSTHFQPPPSNN